jgi:PAS domain S-box-containing protein
MARKKPLPGDKHTTAGTPDSVNDATDQAASVGNASSKPPCFVVGIGASAGGQAALEQLFTSMPHDCGLAFVVIMHLHPEGPSYLPEILGRCTPMPVLTAEDGMPLQPNTINVIPAGMDLTVDEGLIRLETAERTRGVHHPIDCFFQSLAADAAKRGVAVLLSGFGIDGSAGVKAVREAGGVVLAQEPASAVNPAMPKSAIATGAVDFILPAEEIAAKIAEIAKGNCVLPHHTCRVASLDDELGAIFRVVKLKTGHDFSSYKQNTVMRRIERRMAMNEVSGIGKYVALIEESLQEAQALCQDILIGVTSFFRDPEAFEVIRRDVIPRLFEGRDPEEPVRIWHACCATGEEVYSMAMLIQEYLSGQGLNAKVQLFASDIDEPAISQARAGLYSDDIEHDLGRERLNRFFTRTDGRWQVKKQVREMVVFAHHSLIKDPPFSRLDLLVCRNFLIYLNPDMQKRLIDLFHQVLKTGGVLFLGNAETVGRNSELFSTMDNKWKIFERLESKRRMETVFPLATSVRMPTLHRPARPAEPTEPSPGIAAERLLMERYSPPCVVVSDKFETVHVSTRLSRFLEVPTGEPSRDILRMAREELRPTLRAAIYKAFAEQKRIEFRGVKVVDEGSETTVNLIVEPLGPTPGSKLALVIFEPGAPPAQITALSGEEGAHDGETSREMLIRQLEEQLRVTHEQLQATSEQLETSNEGFMSANEELMSINEEFQSANEELQSTNEELETSKEELQALNEELITVNAELQGKVEELNQATSDMENLLASSGIATLFLDRELHIRGFTPAVAGIFNLISADIGRPFRHLAGKIDWPTLAQDAETVLAGQLFAERQVASLDREHLYLKRIFPYRTQEGRIDGIVVTFIDITEHKQAEAALRLSELRYHSLFENMRDGFAYCKMLYDDQGVPVDFVYLDVNDAFTRLTGLENVKGKRVTEVIPGIKESSQDLFEIYNRVALSGQSEKFEIEFKPLSAWFSISVYSMEREHFVAVFDDITQRKRAQEALAESEQRVRRKLDSILSPEGDIGNLELADIIDAEPMQLLMKNFYKLTGMPMGMIDLKGKVLVGVGWQDICTKFHRIHPETLKNCIESDTQLTSGVPQGEYKLYKCKNNMWDVATPIIVGGKQFGNFFLGQFFFDDEPVDYELFRSQAKRHGYDEKEYIAALDKVPRLSREDLATGMAYFMELAGILSKLSYSNIKLARSLAERDSLMESLRESEERFRNMFERHKAVMLLVEPESGAIVDANAAAAEFYGSSREELRRLKIQALNQLPSEEMSALLQEVLLQQRSHFKAPHRLANGESRWVEVYSTPVEAQGKTLLFSIIHDVTDRERAEEERETAVEFLRLVNDSRCTGDLVRAAATFFQERSGCEAVGIRLREGDDYPYYEARGFTHEFVLAENHLCARDEAGQAVLDSNGNPVIDCMCGNVICRRFDPSKPFFTAKGSFWSNCTTELLASTSEADRQARTRNRCNGEGYESVALLPLRLGEESLGLLQLNDKQKGRFSPELITLWERLADYLAVALAKFRADEALHESQKHNEFLAHILEVASQPFSVGYPDGRLGLFNHAYEELTGYTGDELRSIDWENTLTPPEWREGEHEKLEELLRTGRPVRYEKEYIRKDGSRVPIELLVHLAFDAEGKPLYYYAFVTDVTERKQDEEVIQRQVEQLRTTNEELARFNDAMVGRELRMIELKQEINELCTRSGLPLHYEFDEGN